MNASALLTSQGWLGPGHALDSRLTDYGAQTYKQKGHRGLAYDPSQAQAQGQQNSTSISSGNGLVRPLLISQRHGSKHGIGKKAHEPSSGNEWWLKGFASALANVGKSESERSTPGGSGTTTPRSGATTGYVGKHGGLYTYFTSGQVMKGTITQDSDAQKDGEETSTEPKKSKSKKRKSDVLEDPTQDRASTEPLGTAPVKRPQTAKELESSIPYLTERDKERKKAHRRLQSSDVEQFAAIGQFLGAISNTPRNTTHHAQHIQDPAVEEIPQSEVKKQQESREDRRSRRKKKKQDKSSLSLARMVEEELAKLSSLDNTDQDGSGSDPDSNADQSKIPQRIKKKKSGMKGKTKRKIVVEVPI